MREKILEALELAKKFYSEQLDGNYDHQDDELIRYYQLEEEIAEEFQRSMVFNGWYGAIHTFKDLLRFECPKEENVMTVFVIEHSNGKTRIAKRSKQDAVNWFKDNYPHRHLIDIYEQ